MEYIYGNYVSMNGPFDYAFEYVNQSYGFMCVDKNACYYIIRDLLYDAKDKLDEEPEYKTKHIVQKSVYYGLDMLDNPNLTEYFTFELQSEEME